MLSGTAVVEELLLRRIQAWAAELHTLAITHAAAAERLGELCRGMAAKELQQMQVGKGGTRKTRGGRGGIRERQGPGVKELGAAANACGQGGNRRAAESACGG